MKKQDNLKTRYCKMKRNKVKLINNYKGRIKCRKPRKFSHKWFKILLLEKKRIRRRKKQCGNAQNVNQSIYFLMNLVKNAINRFSFSRMYVGLNLMKC